MNHIHEPTDKFLFDSLNLSKPVAAAGGSYFIRFTTNNMPLYIQPPKCKTKQGFLQIGKRYYTDLLFTHENDEFIRWMENLEATCHKHLFENRQKWFEGDMELHDIENYFTSPMKIYKTGKFYIVRVNVQTNLGVPALTIYDEDNREIGIDTIDDKTDIITILEIKGIKCTSTSFHIDIETKQALLVKPVELFTKCVIKSPNPVKTIEPNLNNDTVVAMIPVNETDTDDTIIGPSIIDVNTNLVNNDIDVELHENEADYVETAVTIIDKSNDLVKDNLVDSSPEILDNTEENKSAIHTDESIEKNIVTEIETNLTTNNGDLEEFTIDLDTLNTDENVTIKKSNDVYYEMYREACRKAKIARDLALSSYLEAKRIKNTYLLEDLTDSDESDLEQESTIE